MDRKIIFTIFGIGGIIAGALAFTLLNKSPQPSTQTATPSATTAPQTEQPSSSQPQTTPGRYTDYSADTFASITGTRLLFFYAPWCPQCRQLDADIKQSTLPDTVTVLKIDYDSNQTLRQKYGVTIQTTVVKVDSNGNKVASYVAYDDPVFNAVKRVLLP